MKDDMENNRQVRPAVVELKQPMPSFPHGSPHMLDDKPTDIRLVGSDQLQHRLLADPFQHKHPRELRPRNSAGRSKGSYYNLNRPVASGSDHSRQTLQGKP